jgi:hypothetical protein
MNVIAVGIASRRGNQRPARFAALLSGVAFFFILTVQCLNAQEPPVEEYRIKAAFLLNFAKFVEWPASSFENPADPIEVCIYGRNPFGHFLEETVAGKKIEGHILNVRYLTTPKPAAACHILFVAASESRHAASIVEEVKTPGLLTVVDSNSSAAQPSLGAVINFRLDGDRVRFEIDPGAAERQRLRISSRLLTLGRPVTR